MSKQFDEAFGTIYRKCDKITICFAETADALNLEYESLTDKQKEKIEIYKQRLKDQDGKFITVSRTAYGEAYLYFRLNGGMLGKEVINKNGESFYLSIDEEEDKYLKELLEKEREDIKK